MTGRDQNHVHVGHTSVEAALDQYQSAPEIAPEPVNEGEDFAATSATNTPDQTMAATPPLVEVEDFGSTAPSVSRNSIDPGLPPQLIFRRNSALMIRFVTRKAARVSIHFFDSDGTYRKVPCNGAVCAACLAGHRADAQRLLVVYSVDTGDFRTAVIGSSNESGSLNGQLKEIMAHADHMNFVVEIAKDANNRFTVKIMTKLDDCRKHGGDVIEDYISRGTLDLARIAEGLFPRLTNQQIMATLPQLRAKIELLRPDVNIATL
jgi:hypothetical protein